MLDSGMACGRIPSTDASGRKLRRELPGERLHGRHRRAVAAHERDSGARVQGRDAHDDPRSGHDHASRSEARREEVRPRVRLDRQQEPFEVGLQERHADDSGIRDAHRIERDVDPARSFDHGLQVRIDRALVEGVDLRGIR
nr:hypothetical protein [Agromyces albus]